MAPYKITIRPYNLITSTSVYIADEVGNYLDDFRHFLLKDGSMMLKFPIDGSKTPNDLQAIVGRRMIYDFVDHTARVDYSNSANSDITAYFVVEFNEDFDTIPYRYVSRKSVRGKNFMEFNTGEVERFKGYFTKNKGLVQNIYGQDGNDDVPFSDIESLVGEHAAYEVITFLGTSEWMVRPITPKCTAKIEGQETSIDYRNYAEDRLPPPYLVKHNQVFAYAYSMSGVPYYRKVKEKAGVIA